MSKPADRSIEYIRRKNLRMAIATIEVILVEQATAIPGTASDRDFDDFLLAVQTVVGELKRRMEKDP